MLNDNDNATTCNKKKIKSLSSLFCWRYIDQIESNSLLINMQKHDFLGFLTFPSIYLKRIRRKNLISFKDLSNISIVREREREKTASFRFVFPSSSSADWSLILIETFAIHRHANVCCSIDLSRSEYNVNLTSLKQFQYLNTTRCVYPSGFSSIHHSHTQLFLVVALVFAIKR